LKGSRTVLPNRPHSISIVVTSPSNLPSRCNHWWSNQIVSWANQRSQLTLCAIRLFSRLLSITLIGLNQSRHLARALPHYSRPQGRLSSALVAARNSTYCLLGEGLDNEIVWATQQLATNTTEWWGAILLALVSHLDISICRRCHEFRWSILIILYSVSPHPTTFTNCGNIWLYILFIFLLILRKHAPLWNTLKLLNPHSPSRRIHITWFYVLKVMRCCWAAFDRNIWRWNLKILLIPRRRC
jgi:hypothetical protein